MGQKGRRSGYRMQPPVPLLAAAFRFILRRHMRLEHDAAELDLALARERTAGQLYVHVPFCPSLCPFCTFHRVFFRRDRAEPYFDALHREIDRCYEAGYRFRDLYVGGGTPTVLPQALGSLITHARSRFPLRHVAVETNPSHLTSEVMDILAGVGVDRLSVGVQSFDDALLARMGRTPYGTSDEIVAALEGAAGRFHTLNVDMMFNLPHQTEASLQHDLDTVLELRGVNQATFYPLMATRSSHSRIEGSMGPIPNRERDHYLRIRRTLEPQMPRSSVWCFSKHSDSIDEYMALHDEYVGVGSGAFSYVGGRLYSNTFSIPRYIERVRHGRTAATGGRTLSTWERMRFDLLIKLFALELPKAAIETKWHGQFERTLRKELRLLLAFGAIEEDLDAYRLTEPGLYLWLVLMKEFLNSLNALREDMRRHIEGERRQDARLVASSGAR